MSRGESIAVKAPVRAPRTLRQSLLSLYDSCQYAAYLSVLHDGTVPSHPLFRGRAFHETVHRACVAMQSNGEVRISPDDCKAIMAEVLADHPEWIVPAYALDELRVMLHHWAECFVLPVGAVTESPWSLEVDGQTVTGTIDLLWREGDTVHLRDYKAGWQVYTQGEVSGKDPSTGESRGARAAQLITYALLVADGIPGVRMPFDLRGVNRFDCRFVFPMVRRDDGLLERDVTISSPELIEHREWLERNVKSLVARFSAGKFTAATGSVCRRCPQPGECPLRSRVGQLGPFERPASEVAEDWLFLEADRKRLGDELKVYVTQFGPVPVGTDQQVGFVATASGTRFGVQKRDAA